MSTDKGEIAMSESNSRSDLLAGIKVLDFTHVLAGPTCPLILADLGAEVITFEAAPTGDVARGVFLVENNLSALFLSTCAGKKSLCVDLKKQEGVQIARLTQAGVLVEEERVKALREQEMI